MKTETKIVIGGAFILGLYALSKIGTATTPPPSAWKSLSISNFNLWNDGACTQCQPILNSSNNSVRIPFPPNGIVNCAGGVCGGDYPTGVADTCPSTNIGSYISSTNGMKFNGIFNCGQVSMNCTGGIPGQNLCGEMNVALSYWNDPCCPLEYGFLTWFNTLSGYGYIMAYLQGHNSSCTNFFWSSPKVADYDGLEHEYKALVNPSDNHTIDYYIDGTYKLSITNPNDSYANIPMKYIFSVHRWGSYDSTNWGLNVRNPQYIN